MKLFLLHHFKVYSSLVWVTIFIYGICRPAYIRDPASSGHQFLFFPTFMGCGKMSLQSLEVICSTKMHIINHLTFPIMNKVFSRVDNFILIKFCGVFNEVQNPHVLKYSIVRIMRFEYTGCMVIYPSFYFLLFLCCLWSVPAVISWEHFAN